MRLDTLVESIPLSNPLFLTPSAASSPFGAAEGTQVIASEQKAAIKKLLEKRFNKKASQRALKIDKS